LSFASSSRRIGVQQESDYFFTINALQDVVVDWGNSTTAEPQGRRRATS